MNSVAHTLAPNAIRDIPRYLGHPCKVSGYNRWKRVIIFSNSTEGQMNVDISNMHS